MSSEKLNCWEILNCGRQPGGEMAHDMGICPAAADVDFHGVNGGINAGRFCWAVAGTMCDNQISGTMAQKLSGCMQCDIYLHIVEAEGAQLILSPGQL